MVYEGRCSANISLMWFENHFGDRVNREKANHSMGTPLPSWDPSITNLWGIYRDSCTKNDLTVLMIRRQISELPLSLWHISRGEFTAAPRERTSHRAHFVIGLLDDPDWKLQNTGWSTHFVKHAWINATVKCLIEKHRFRVYYTRSKTYRSKQFVQISHLSFWSTIYILATEDYFVIEHS